MPTRKDKLTELLAAIDSFGDNLDNVRDDVLTLIDEDSTSDDRDQARRDLLVEAGEAIHGITKLLPLLDEHCAWIEGRST